MKCTMKKLVSKVMAIIILICVLMGGGMSDVCDVLCVQTATLIANAAESDTLTGSCGDSDSDVTYTWDKTIGLVVLSGTGKIKNYGESPFKNSDAVKTVMISEGITSIGNSLFLGCSQLENVVLPKSVTGIGNNAFDGCSALQNIDLPSNLNYIGSRAFQSCKIEKIAIPSTVTVLKEYAFCECRRLSEVDLGDGLVTIEQGCFRNTAITEIAFPSTLRNVYGYNFGAFSNCSIESVYVTDPSLMFKP